MQHAKVDQQPDTGTDQSGANHAAQCAEAALGGWVDGKSDAGFIPFVAKDQVDARMRVAVRSVLPSYRHMRVEESDVFPLAERAFRAREWRAINQDFLAHADPLFGELVASRYKALADRLGLTGAPSGTE